MLAFQDGLREREGAYNAVTWALEEELTLARAQLADSEKTMRLLRGEKPEMFARMKEMQISLDQKHMHAMRAT